MNMSHRNPFIAHALPRRDAQPHLSHRCLSALLLATVAFSGLLCSCRSNRVVSVTYTDSSVRADLPNLKSQSADLLTPGQIFVQFKSGASSSDKRRVNKKFGEALIAAIRGLKPSSGETVRLASTSPGDMETVWFKGSSSSRWVDLVNNRLPVSASWKNLAAVRDDPSVSFAQPNYQYQLTDTADDDFYMKGRLWNLYGDGHPLVGQNSSQYGTEVEKAWKNGHTGSDSVYVAVLDTGADETHTDLGGNLDMQDAADYIRDAEADPNVAPLVNVDEVGHGTHIAGIIGALGDNKIGIVGINWHIRIIPFKVAGQDRVVSTGAAVNALEQVVKLKQMGKNIVAVNLSWAAYAPTGADGKPALDLALFRAIKDAGRAGILCVAAAKNDGSDNDGKPAYPASFDTTRDLGDGSPVLDFDSVVSVAALAPNGTLADFSNFGSDSVHIAAPGVNIISTVPRQNMYFSSANTPIIKSTDGSTYAALTGTSMAAPHVTGAVALYFASHPGATAKDARDAILNNAKPDPALVGKVQNSRRLDLASF